MINGVTHAQLRSIWCHSKPSDVPYSPNQFLGLDFFCRFLTANRHQHLLSTLQIQFKLAHWPLGQSNTQFLPRPARKELNEPNLKSRYGYTVLIYILWIQAFTTITSQTVKKANQVARKYNQVKVSKFLSPNALFQNQMTLSTVCNDKK